MQIQVNTDNHIAGGMELNRQVEAVVEGSLGRFGDQVTRVEVHLTDESSAAKSRDDDKRCVMEVRLAGLQPIAVSHQGPTLDQALEGAADKLQRTLVRTLGRMDDRRGRSSFGGEQTI